MRFSPCPLRLFLRLEVGSPDLARSPTYHYLESRSRQVFCQTSYQCRVGYAHLVVQAGCKENRRLVAQESHSVVVDMDDYVLSATNGMKNGDAGSDWVGRWEG